MKKIIMIGEDNILFKNIRNFCEEKGDSVIYRFSGADGMHQLLRAKFDLVICSLFMEEVDGVTLVQTLKLSNTINSLTPIVLLTSEPKADKLFNQETRPDAILLKNELSLKNFEQFYRSKLAQIVNKQYEVLYVEDNKLAQKIVKMWLEKLDNFKVDICDSVSTLDNFLSNTYDLLISDNVLSDGTSEDIIKQVQNSSLKNLPIFIVTATPEKLDLSKFQLLGNVIAIMPKPFSVKLFLEKIDQYNF